MATIIPGVYPRAGVAGPNGQGVIGTQPVGLNSVARWKDTVGTKLGDSLLFIDEAGNLTTIGRYNGRDIAADGAQLDIVVTAVPRIPSQPQKDALAGTDGTPSGTNKYVTDSDPRLTGGGGGGINPPAGQIGGTAGSPTILGIRETGGPTLLTFSSIADGKLLQRSGTSIVGAAVPFLNEGVVAVATDHTISATETYVAVTSTAAVRTMHLPPAASVPAGWKITIQDESGAAGNPNAIKVIPDGVELLNGLNLPRYITMPYKDIVVVQRNSQWWLQEWSSAPYNVLDFGVVGDGTTDDAPAINALITSLSSDLSYKGAMIFMPRGTYRLASPIRVNRQIMLYGESGSGWYSSTILKPDKNVSGIVIEANTTSVDGAGGGGSWSVIRDLSVQYAPNSSTVWQATHAYVVGDIVRALANYNYQCAFRCTTAGTTGGSEPSWSGTQQDVTVTDGGVTWTAIVASGIRFHARAKIENVYVTGAACNGLHVVADTSGRTIAIGGLSRTSGVVTVTTPSPHGWGTGNLATLTSVDVNFPAGDKRITVTGNTSFTYVEAGSDGVSTASTSIVVSTNANAWRASYMRIDNCGLNGIFVTGGDTNAGMADSIDVGACGLWCVYDSSFLGNTYVGCEAAADVGQLGSYQSDNANARNMFLGCYSEGGPPSRIRSPAMVVGGLHGAGFTADSQGAFYENGKQTNTYSFQGNATDGYVRFGWGQQFDGINVWDVVAYDGAQAVLGGTTFRMKYIHSGGGAGFYRFDLENSDGVMPYGIATSQQSVFQPGTVTFGNGIGIGVGAGWNALFAAVRVVSGSAPPGSGANTVGDLVINTAVGGPIWWKCTVTGNPGTWVPVFASAATEAMVTVAVDQSPTYAANNGTTYLNSSADVVINLPTSPTQGATFRGQVIAAHHIKFLAGGANVIYNGGAPSSAGGYIDSNVIGSIIELKWNGTYWFTTAINGSWSIA